MVSSIPKISIWSLSRMAFEFIPQKFPITPLNCIWSQIHSNYTALFAYPLPGVVILPQTSFLCVTAYYNNHLRKVGFTITT